MARLNEPPVSTDSIETLRKRFLRQNRDIARVNSAQSLRIRSLESECGRLLSENLALNGRILELERQLDESQGAQRIADHALEIKARMEAQLIEWGAMLAGMGLEPAAKRQATTSPNGRRIARPRRSMGRSPKAKQRPRDSRSTEAVAMQEGRLPVINENKSYPRRTMNHNEILAICSEATDTNDSPDLGPPPTSRFVEEEPVKIDSPSRSTGVPEPSPSINEEALPPSNAPSQPILDPRKRTTQAPEAVSTEDPKPVKAPDAQARPSVKAGSKRKFGDENDDVQVSRAFAHQEKANGKTSFGKPLAVRDAKTCRSAKDLSTEDKHDEKNGPTTELIVTRTRKPLADKSTNDDLTSPKKLVKSATTGDLKKVMMESGKEFPMKAAPLKKKRVVPIKLAMPPPTAPPMAKPPQEPETPSADPELVHPGTPETRSTTHNAKDTPPPGDISVHGEISRPSRRVRAAVSYAEPNLRDKMRRPTKELLDAVSGEGRYVRSSSAHLTAPTSSSNVKAEGEVSDSGSSKQLPNAEAAMADEAARRGNVVSPLQQREPLKELSPADLPSTIVTERRRRPSSRQSQLFEQLREPADKPDEGMAIEGRQEIDPYEFQSTSPVIEEPRETAVKGRITKGMRRSMAVKSGRSDDAPASMTESSRHSRKRASMAAPKKSTMLYESLDDDSSYEASGDVAKGASGESSLLGDRISRRRSTML